LVSFGMWSPGKQWVSNFGLLPIMAIAQLYPENAGLPTD